MAKDVTHYRNRYDVIPCHARGPVTTSSDTEEVTCRDCKRSDIYQRAHKGRRQYLAAERWRKTHGGPCHQSGCNKSGTWRRVFCQRHPGIGREGFACEDHPFTFTCSSCEWDAGEPERAAARAGQEAQQQAVEARHQLYISEQLRAGYTPDEAEALAIHREKEEKRAEEQKNREALQRAYEEGKYGRCPSCGTWVKAVNGVVMAHNRSAEEREYPWQERFPDYPCSGVGEKASPPR